MKTSVYLVCPVRNASPEQTTAIAQYVHELEAKGYEVYWPARDTVQEDETNGWQVCLENARAILKADEIHVWWDASSQGSAFDLGMAWMLRFLREYPPTGEQKLPRCLVLANTFPVPQGKAFEKVLLRWADEGEKSQNVGMAVGDQ